MFDPNQNGSHWMPPDFPTQLLYFFDTKKRFGTRHLNGGSPLVPQPLKKELAMKN